MQMGQRFAQLAQEAMERLQTLSGGARELLGQLGLKLVQLLKHIAGLALLCCEAMASWASRA